MAPSHVLIPLDGSPLAEEALVQALESFDCRVTVLNVVTPVDAKMNEGGILDSGEDCRENAHDRAGRIIELASAQASEGNRPVETAVETGDPAETILAYVAEHDIDHVVMEGYGDEQSDLHPLLGVVAAQPQGVTVCGRQSHVCGMQRRPAGQVARARLWRRSIAPRRWPST